MGGQAAPQIVLYKNGGSGSGDGDNRSTNSGLFFVCLHVQQIKHGPPQRSSSHRNTNRQFATCVRAAAAASSLHQKDNLQPVCVLLPLPALYTKKTIDKTVFPLHVSHRSR